MVTVKGDEDILSLTANGYGKRTPLADYRPQHRGGRGLITIKCSERNGRLIGIRDVNEDDELMVITRQGILIRISVADISVLGRNTQGVRIIRLEEGDLVADMTKITCSDDEDVIESAGETSPGDEPDDGMGDAEDVELEDEPADEAADDAEGQGGDSPED